MMFIMTVRITD